LTREIKLIGISGRFAWGVEATPLFAQFDPSTIYGVGFAPVVWRWNFPPKPRWSAFAELSMGGLWTTDPIPEKSGRANFTAHWGGGVRLRPRGAHAILIAYRFQRISRTATSSERIQSTAMCSWPAGLTARSSLALQMTTA
jgi:hypothetical protein